MSEPNGSQQISTQRSRFREYGPQLVFVVTLTLLLAHSFVPNYITIDRWSIVLLVLLAILPFITDVKELVVTPEEGIKIIKTAGELQDQFESTKDDAIEKLRRRVEQLERGDEQPELEDKISNRIDQVHSEIREISQTQSPDLAFLELVRILEREIREFLEVEGVRHAQKAGFGELIQLAREHKLLDRHLILNLEDIRQVRNQVAHGKEIESNDAEQMIELGIHLLEAIWYEIETSDISESAYQNAVLQNPSIVEEGFEPQKTEVRTDYGIIDLLGKDKDGRNVFVEFKTQEATVNHLKQLLGLTSSQKHTYGEDLRGILIAPSVIQELRQFQDDSISIKEIDFHELFDYER